MEGEKRERAKLGKTSGGGARSTGGDPSGQGHQARDDNAADVPVCVWVRLCGLCVVSAWIGLGLPGAGGQVSVFSRPSFLPSFPFPSFHSCIHPHTTGPTPPHPAHPRVHPFCPRAPTSCAGLGKASSGKPRFVWRFLGGRPPSPTDASCVIALTASLRTTHLQGLLLDSIPFSHAHIHNYSLISSVHPFSSSPATGTHPTYHVLALLPSRRRSSPI